MSRRNRAAAYTLIEMLVAITVFAFVITATGFALTTAVRGYETTNRHIAQTEEDQAILEVIARDLRSAYASENNKSTFFLASGATEGELLTFTTLGARLEPGLTEGEGIGEEIPTPPQSSLAIVRYSLDATTTTLSRTWTTVPNVEMLPDPQDPRMILSRRVTSVRITYLDSEMEQQDAWEYQHSDTNQGSGSTSQSFSTTLPTAVNVSIELISQSGVPRTLSTTVLVQSPTPQTEGQTPPEAPEETGGTGGTGGGAGGGGAGGGGTGGGGSGGGGLTPRSGLLPGLPGLHGANR